MEQVIGATIDGYKITERLGQGGMGAVFLGTKDGAPPVAIKLLLLQNRDEQLSAVSRLIDEIKAARAIKHPNVVPIISTGCHEQFGLFVVYDFISGGSLDHRLQRRGRLSEKEVLDVLVPSVLKGLQALHSQGVFHRDIKPANILYDGQGSYLIGDLGLAVFEGRKAKTKTGTFVGTPGYMPPERINSAKKDGNPQGDIYSATILFIEALTGKKPFKSTLPVEIIKETVGRQFKAAELVKLGVPKALAHSFARALSLKTEERPVDCQSYLEEIKAAQSGEEKTRTLVASSVDLLESMAGMSAPSDKDKRPALYSGRKLFFLIFMVLAMAGLGWRFFGKKSPIPRGQVKRSRSMQELLHKWSQDVKEVNRRRFKGLLDKEKSRRLRDIQRAFHRGFDFKKINIGQALKLENEIISTIFYCDWGSDPHQMDEILLQSETFLNDLPPYSHFAPTWVLCWHLHLLVRASFCQRAGISYAARAIRTVLSVNPLPVELDSEGKALVEKLHKKLNLPRPVYVLKSKRMKVLTGLGLSYKKYYVITGNLHQRLSLKSIRHFMDKTVDEQNEQKRIRNRYGRRIVAGFWNTYLVRTQGNLCQPLFWEHQKYVTWLLKARYSDASELLSEKDFPWGPGMSSPLVIKSIFSHWRNLIKHSVKVDALDDWSILFELFEEIRDILRNLEGEALSTYRQGLEETILPLLPAKNIFRHLIKARLIIEDPKARTTEKPMERFRAAEPHSRAALEIAMNAIKKSDILANWTESHWLTMRRVGNMRFAVLDTVNDFSQIEKEGDALSKLVHNYGAKAGTRSAFHMRDIALLATLMKTKTLEQQNKPLPPAILKMLIHAKDNLHEYDTGRRHSAILVLKRHGVK